MNVAHHLREAGQKQAPEVLGRHQRPRLVGVVVAQDEEVRARPDQPAVQLQVVLGHDLDEASSEAGVQREGGQQVLQAAEVPGVGEHVPGDIENRAAAAELADGGAHRRDGRVPVRVRRLQAVQVLRPP